MKHQKTTFNSLLIRYNRYRKKLIRLHKAGKNEHRQLVLKKHLERIYTKLSSLPVSLSKQAVLAASFTAAMTFTTEKANSQVEFKENTINMFSLEPLPGSIIEASVINVDLDNDGDLDLMTSHYDGNFRYYENIGSTSAPVYGPFVLNPFSLTDAGGYVTITAADLDNDGDIDILINQSDYFYGTSGMKYFENIGSAGTPSFATPVVDPFGLPASYIGNIQLVDIDGDNDLDLTSMNGNLNYYENIGSISSPNFASATNNPFTLSHLTYQGRFADFDNDGDLDIITAWGASTHYFENIGTTTNATFATAVISPFGFKTTFGSVTGIEAFDIDGDNDLDLIYNNPVTGDFHFYQNVGTASLPKFTDGHTNLFSLDEQYQNYPDASFGDLDGDGDLDLLAENNGDFFYYPNVGTASNPNFGTAQTNPFGLQMYSGMAVSLVDIDGDNDLDIMASYNVNFNFIENTGTQFAPSFAAPQYAPFSIPDSWGDIKADFADLDNDGDMDILAEIGIYGDVYYFENTGSSTNPVFTAPITNPFSLGSNIERRDPSLGDLDNDGDLDLIFGNRYSSGFIYNENIGTASAPVFGLDQGNPFNLREVAYDANNNFDVTPCFVDLNNDGRLDLMAGAQYRGILFFENITQPSTAGITTNVNIMETIAIYPNPASDFMTIKTDEDIEKVQLFDISGDLIQSETTNNFSIEDLSPGVYIIDVKIPSGMYRTRLVKK